MHKVNLTNKFKLFDAYWTSKILEEVNNSHVKIFKAKGEFVWNSHQDKDEFFLVLKGQLNIKMKDQEVCLKQAEFFILPKGVEHLPYADEEAHVLLFEPKAVINTGNTISEKTGKEPVNLRLRKRLAKP